MVEMKQISELQAREFIRNGEFGREIIDSKPKVAVVLSQSWCPQWAALKQWIGEIQDPDVAIWFFIYDKSDIFEQFLEFKEKTLGNYEIPYIRYYHVGKLLNATNYVNKERFLKTFQG